MQACIRSVQVYNSFQYCRVVPRCIWTGCRKLMRHLPGWANGTWYVLLQKLPVPAWKPQKRHCGRKDNLLIHSVICAA